ncbi:T9SS type A sorting domain-containing protein [candidate division GN15 bacterium]|nr:T9SS type A sorting domain-containing protein [candidate division GN15 bacterium]
MHSCVYLKLEVIEYYKEHYMMQKRTLYSLLIISFLVVFAASAAMANTVTVQSKADLPRCADQAVNVTADVTTSGVSAIELVLEISQTSGCANLENLAWEWGLDADVLTERYVEIVSDGTAPDTLRAAAMYVDNGSGLAAGTGILIGTLEFTTNDCCAGEVTIDNTVFDYPNETCDITTAFVDAAGSNVAVTVVPGTVSIANQNPTIDAIADVTLPWNTGTVNVTATGDDPDLANGCESLTFQKVAGPAALTVAANGNISWDPTGDDVCDHEVEVKVVDECGAEVSTTFNVCVTNEPPVITCPDDQLVFAGETLEVQATAVDPDGGPNPLVFTLADDGGFPGTITVDPATGEITMPTEVEADQTGFFDICISVSDSANTCDPCSPSNSDECCFTVEVRSMAVYIEKIHDQIQGEETTVSIDMLGGDFNNWAIGGFDLLIAYDASALNFMFATEGDFFVDCGWEYFTYREGANGNCGGGCPTGLVRIVGLAETNNGAAHPDCFDNSGNDLTQLATMTFLVSNDRTLECQYVPIKFFWVDCGDNGFSDVSGEYFLISRWVFDYFGTEGEDSWVQVNTESDLPTYYGAPSVCDVFTEKGEPLRAVDFYNGGVDIICADSIDAVGDINLNGISYEVADAVMLTNYFIEGLSAFGTHVDGSIAASDANKDGNPLTVADLVYIIRVVIGDAVPYDKLDVVHATYAYEDNVLSIDREMGAVYAVFEGVVDVDLLANNMEIRTGVRDGNTHVVVYPDAINATFQGEFLRANGRLIGSPEFATYDGATVAAKNVPRTFRVEQNYPNPFNPSTNISFALPTAGEWTIEIFNVTGQVVETFDGVSEAGIVNVEWNANDLASGVYFYRVAYQNHSKTMKAILLK